LHFLVVNSTLTPVAQNLRKVFTVEAPACQRFAFTASLAAVLSITGCVLFGLERKTISVVLEDGFFLIAPTGGVITTSSAAALSNRPDTQS
jgi:hypothetical protein